MTIFEKTYAGYLAQVGEIDLKSLEHLLGISVRGVNATIPLFGKAYQVSKSGVFDPSGKKPALDICVILSKYLILRTPFIPEKCEWVTYRDMKDSGPLTSYFANDVERSIASHFEGRLSNMKKACQILGGYDPCMDISYDLSIRFDALPRIPILVLFNDADDEFRAKCSVLFERRAEKYLDPECLAMLGRCLFTSLRDAECEL